MPMVVAAQSIGSEKKYVSLGDSVAAGAGLPLQDETAVSQACGRSSAAYPHLLATELGMSHVQLACGGATLKAGILGQQTAGNLTLPAQIDEAFVNGVPDVITLTVGTNDLHWSDFIRKCYATTCGTPEDSQAINSLLLEVNYNLHSTLKTIQEKSGSKRPIVIVTGYFQPLSNNNPPCSDTQGITSEEITWVRRQDKKLNALIYANTWSFDFVRYAPVDFTGHELCSTEPWLQGLQDKASYHPNTAGQAAIADAVIDKLRR